MKRGQKAKPTCVVVDTNVLAVAQGMHNGASDECRLNCAKVIRRLHAGRYVAVLDSDSSGEAILSEYTKRLRGTGVSGIGTKLVLKLVRNRNDPSVCRSVEITPSDALPGSYEEVPAHLHDFDLDDHKWFAAAIAEGSRPRLYQALDEEWWSRRRDIADAGLDTHFLCGLDLPDD